MLEVMRGDPLPLRVLLGSGSSRVEEVVDALEGPAALAGYLGVLA